MHGTPVGAPWAPTGLSNVEVAGTLDQSWDSGPWEQIPYCRILGRDERQGVETVHAATSAELAETEAENRAGARSIWICFCHPTLYFLFS